MQRASPWVLSRLSSADWRDSAGEIVTLYGFNFGTSAPSVVFNGSPATVLASSNCQITAVVPFELDRQGTAEALVSVFVGRQSLGPIKLPVVASVPGIFTADGIGSGQAAILNQDGSVNSLSNPAAVGSIISVFITGRARWSHPCRMVQSGQ